jgi:hypothetical protein
MGKAKATRDTGARGREYKLDVFVIGSPKGHNDEDDDLEDADELEVVEKKFFAIAFGEIISDFWHDWLRKQIYSD